MAEQHTPGPWFVNGFAIRARREHSTDPEHNALIADTWFDGDRPRVEANARLIAASPDMLDALGSIQSLASMLHGEQPEASPS